MQNLEESLHLHETDMTIFYRELCKISSKTDVTEAFKIISIAFYNFQELVDQHNNTWMQWLESYRIRLQFDLEQSP